MIERLAVFMRMLGCYAANSTVYGVQRGGLVQHHNGEPEQSSFALRQHIPRLLRAHARWRRQVQGGRGPETSATVVASLAP